jgi:hypothetical protein
MIMNLLTHATTAADFAALWHDAKQAAQSAAEAENFKLGDENARGLDCGFAWVTLPGNIAFGRWAKKQGIASKGYPTGLSIWYSKLHNVPTQSISVHEAAVRAARDVLSHGLQTSLIGMASRLD